MTNSARERLNWHDSTNSNYRATIGAGIFHISPVIFFDRPTEFKLDFHQFDANNDWQSMRKIGQYPKLTNAKRAARYWANRNIASQL